jgi:hypothetical protein
MTGGGVVRKRGERSIYRAPRKSEGLQRPWEKRQERKSGRSDGRWGWKGERRDEGGGCRCQCESLQGCGNPNLAGTCRKVQKRRPALDASSG